jgi:orotidine-5'-phosphate decarboxylase
MALDGITSTLDNQAGLTYLNIPTYDAMVVWLESRVIIAVDPSPGTSLDRWVSLASSLCDLVAGFKVGLPFMFSYGASGLRALRGSCDGLLIADFKLADVEHVMVSTLSHVIGYVDGVIAHSFIGLKGGLEGLKGYLDSVGVRLILVISMSHEGSLDVIDVNIDRLLWVAGRLKPWGLVAPATRPQVISHVRGRAPWAVILAPGVGVQGARPGDGIRAGADYEIVGRLVTETSKPVEVVKWINGEHARALRERGG